MSVKEASLYLHDYKLFPYERNFAIREVKALLEPNELVEANKSLIVSGLKNKDNIKRLVYFSHAVIEDSIFPTHQYQCEKKGNSLKQQKRQNTRYSVHGLHEYKGKFNPQVVKALLNIYKIKEGDLILDPFCGSGTTLVEASFNNIKAHGTDINPLAVFIANSKIEALSLKARELDSYKKILFENYSKIYSDIKLDMYDPRIQYLRKWFDLDTLKEIESFRLSVLGITDSIQNIFLVVISNLLRDYSLQEPSDLRVRRRFSPYPEISLKDRIMISIDNLIDNVKLFQENFGPINSMNKAFNLDIKDAIKNKQFEDEQVYDFAITSPPYATALPYIDTQRLSLVWLNLISPKEIKSLESDLIGSREFKFKADQDLWNRRLIKNEFNLPEEIHGFCCQLLRKINSKDGFRKRALPALLYRYFSEMLVMFIQVHRLLKSNKHFCLIVGHNHTTIGGDRTDINTPELLTCLGIQAGFELSEHTELEAYQRYGLHSSNAVQKESLIVFIKK